MISFININPKSDRSSAVPKYPEESVSGLDWKWEPDLHFFGWDEPFICTLFLFAYFVNAAENSETVARFKTCARELASSAALQLEFQP